MAVDLPFDTVSAVVADTREVVVERETRRHPVEAVGQAVEAPEQTAAPEGLVLLADGAMIHTEAAWHDAQGGVCPPLVRTGPTTLTPQGPADMVWGLSPGPPSGPGSMPMPSAPGSRLPAASSSP